MKLCLTYIKCYLYQSWLRTYFQYLQWRWWERKFTFKGWMFSTEEWPRICYWTFTAWQALHSDCYRVRLSFNSKLCTITCSLAPLVGSSKLHLHETVDEERNDWWHELWCWHPTLKGMWSMWSWQNAEEGAKFIGTSSILARGKSRALPTDPHFTLSMNCTSKIPHQKAFIYVIVVSYTVIVIGIKID